jgi:hypothetical protein
MNGSLVIKLETAFLLLMSQVIPSIRFCTDTASQNVPIIRQQCWLEEHEVYEGTTEVKLNLVG